MGQLKGGTYVGGDLTIANNIVAGGTLTTNNDIYVNGKVFTNGKANTGDQDLSNLSTYDYVNNTFLKLAGGTMTGQLTISSNGGDNQFNINRIDGGEVYFRLISGGVAKAALTSNNPYYGTSIFDNTSGTYLGISPSGIPHFQGNTIWHSGNFTNLNQLTTRNFSDLQNKPTTIDGYQITDGVKNNGGLWNISIKGRDNTAGNALLQSGSGRSDDESGSTWLFLDSAGGTSAPWGIKHNQTDNYIEYYGGGSRKAYINLSNGYIYTNGKANTGDQDLSNLSTYSYVDNTFLKLAGGTMTGELTLSRLGLTTDNFIKFKNDDQNCYFGVRNPYGSYGLTFVSPDGTYNKVWHSGNDGTGSGLDADMLNGRGGFGYLKSYGFQETSGLDFNTIDLVGSNDGFCARCESGVLNPPIPNVYNWSLWQQGSKFRGSQIAIHAYAQGTGMYVRSSSLDDNAWNNWRKVAFEDSNVASATRLQTGRYLFGQYFDGTSDVNGNCVINYNGEDGGVKINNNSDTYSAIRFNDTSGNFATIHAFSEAHYLYNGEKSINIDAAGAVTFGGWNNPILYVQRASKNVGINTTNPAYNLDVNGTLRAKATTLSSTLRIQAAEGNYSEGIRIKPVNNWVTILLGGTDLTADAGTSTNTWSIHNNDGNFYINRNAANANTGYELCNVNGNWGVGTNVPAYKLDVNGSFNVNGISRIIPSNVPTYDGIIVSKILGFQESPYGLITRVYADGRVGLQVQRESNGAEVFALSLNESGGNVLIGTGTNSGYKLDVNGTLRATGTITAQNGIITDYDGGNWITMATRVNQIRGDNNATPTAAHSLYCVKNSNGDAIAFGGLGVSTGFYGFTANTIANNINNVDWSTAWDVSTGQLNHSGNFYAGGSIYSNSYIAAGNRIFTGYDSGQANSISCSNWFISNGATGWYNGTYGGGITMTDSTYVRVHNYKAFKVSSTASDSINTDGGVLASGTIYASGIITGSAIRTTNTSDYSLIVRNSSAPTLFVQNSSTVSPQIASFRYGSATAGGGTSVLDINSGSVVSTVGYSKSGSSDSEVLLGGGGTCTRSDVLPIIQGDLSVVNSSYVSSSSVRAYQLGHIVIIQGTFKTGGSASNDTAYFTIPSTIGVPFDDTGWSGVAGNQNTGIKMYIPKGSRTIYLIWNDTGTSTFYQMSWVYYTATSIY